MSQAETTKQSGRNWAHIIRDVVETIAFALVLVLVFREFAFGGYVIPTGSMAPTLYGTHRTQICSDCGSEYAYGIHQQDLPSGGVQLLLPKRVVCPNCRWLEHPPPLYQGGRAVFDGGDRIMVVKVGYELAEWFPKLAGYLAPKRWDVVVFKSPAEPEINLIKRLVGLPGEKIEIIDGDIYANDKIQRKSSGAQQALWFTVYDADYLPNRQAAKPAWRDVDGPGPSLWDTSGRVMTFAGRDKPEESATIEFVGTVVDYYAYADLDRQQFGRSIVSDLRLSMLLVPGAGTTAGGSIQLHLSKGNDLFIAEIDLTGRVRLLKGTRQPPGQGQMELLSQQSLAPITKPTVVSFANVDHRLSVSLNGREILSSTDDQYPAVSHIVRQMGPERDGPIAQVRAQGANLELWHLKLQRDIYYRWYVRINDSTMPVDHPLFNQPGHGVAGNPIQLGPDQYYVLGDNSPESKDCRLWWQVGPHLQNSFLAGQYKIGTVPADQMVGRAFFIYCWPRYRLFGKGPPLIPNVGRMRFIR